MGLTAYLINHIQKKGPLSFKDYMQMCLYDKHYGYYTAHLPKFGKEGDFVTAPEITPIFGYCLANQVSEVTREIKDPVILEFGAGTGRLCIDILTELEQKNNLPEAYAILEVSPSLKARQKAFIQESLPPSLYSRVKWIDTLPKAPFKGVMIANEVLDAMPVHQFLLSPEGFFESFVEAREEKLKVVYKPCHDDRLIAHVEGALKISEVPYLSEANLMIPGWLKACSERMVEGLLLLIDYGLSREEYYHPDRNQGTLMCHYQHKAHTNPLAHPGEEDITAHVDFTHVAESAHSAGFDVLGYTNQASFLLSNGYLEFLSDLKGIKNQVSATQGAKKLLQEHEMGELFKVMALGKGIELALSGFQMMDRRFRL